MHSVYDTSTATVVVICWSTPEVGHYAMAVCQQGFAVHVHIVYHACVAVDGNGHALCSHFVACQHAVHLDCAGECRFCILLRNGLRGIGILQGQLLMCYHIAGRLHIEVVAQYKLHVEHNILSWIGSQGRLDSSGINLHGSSLLLGKVYSIYALLADLLAIHQNREQHTDIVGTSKELLVVNGNCALFQIDVLYPIVLVAVLHLVGMRMERTVGSHNAIAVEIVVRGRIAAGVTAIHPYLVAGNLALATHGLVHHIPDETALI